MPCTYLCLEAVELEGEVPQAENQGSMESEASQASHPPSNPSFSCPFWSSVCRRTLPPSSSIKLKKFMRHLFPSSLARVLGEGDESFSGGHCCLSPLSDVLAEKAVFEVSPRAAQTVSGWLQVHQTMPQVCGVLSATWGAR